MIKHLGKLVLLAVTLP
ncbi:UNVERIFIED_CONTAM: hypothetical protein GTU68_053624 [Idotea baltica]|nr:hypothetical protein [Idotea baltica]